MNVQREQLEQALGIKLSNDWCDGCYTALQQQQQRVTTDMMFEQLLYHDLRDVVRGNNDRDELHTPLQPVSQQHLQLPLTAALLLRNAITTSVERNGTTHKNTLPSSFRCCLQIEEICDVSKNAESRFTTPTTTSSSSCQKLCLIDGYYPSQALVAIEVASILTPAAGVSKLLPGSKILLFGPIIVRHGLLGLHSGNCLLLGGQVERLIQIQHQAVENAKQLSGHGIDPTIRALIWNNRHNDNDENDGDEGNSFVRKIRSSAILLRQRHLLFPMYCCR